MSNEMNDPRVAQLVAELDLHPHPEGGWFRETYRAPASPDGVRAASTAIYFLLSDQSHSRFHRIDADEGWHHYEGDPVRVHILDQSGYRWVDVGPLDGSGVAPQTIVPADAWFAAEVLVGPHGYSLVGCTVAPAFEFERFELAQAAELMVRYPEHAALIERLC